MKPLELLTTFAEFLAPDTAHIEKFTPHCRRVEMRVALDFRYEKCQLEAIDRSSQVWKIQLSEFSSISTPFNPVDVIV